MKGRRQGKGGKGKGGKGKGGKGKGGKGKGGKGPAEPRGQQLQNELANVVEEVLGKDKMSKLQGQGTGTQAYPSYKPKRKTVRKEMRQEKKRRRADYFSRNPWQPEPSKAPSAAEKSGPAAKKRKVPAEGAASQRTGKQKRRQQQDDDEDITSEEEGQHGSQSKGKSKASHKGQGEEGGDDAEDEASSEGEDAADDDDADDGDDDGDDGDDSDDGSNGNERPEKNGERTKSATGGYLPPHLRGRAAAAEKQQGSQQHSKLRGTLNRVTEGNLEQSGRDMCGVLAEMVSQEGPRGAAETLLKLLLPAAVGDPSMSVLVLGCHAALVISAHVLYGAAFGAAALQQVGTWLGQHLPAAEKSEEATGQDAMIAKNCVTFCALLFSFGFLPGNVMFDLVRFIFKGGAVSEIRIELALTALRYAGRKLRAECAEDFREMLKFIGETAAGAQRGSAEAEADSDIQSRVNFLLREVQDMRSKKVSFAAMDRFNAISTWLQTTALLGGKKVNDHLLSVPFKFLEEAAPVDWPLGAAAEAAVHVRRGAAKASAAAAGHDSLRAAAVQQRLTTELRQSVFVALMGAEDFEDAAERLALVAAGTKTGPPEAGLILFHCAVRERAPNPFYEHVAVTLCNRAPPWGKRFAHSLKRAAVQHLQQAHTYGLRATVALAELCAAFIATPDVGVPLSVIRFMRFGNVGDTTSGAGGSQLGNSAGLLLRHMAESVLRRLVDAEAAVSIFGGLRKYDDVREGVLLVMDGLVRPKLPGRAEVPELWKKFQAARKELTVRAANVDSD